MIFPGAQQCRSLPTASTLLIMIWMLPHFRIACYCRFEACRRDKGRSIIHARGNCQSILGQVACGLQGVNAPLFAERLCFRRTADQSACPDWSASRGTRAGDASAAERQHPSDQVINTLSGEKIRLVLLLDR